MKLINELMRIPRDDDNTGENGGGEEVEDDAETARETEVLEAEGDVLDLLFHVLQLLRELLGPPFGLWHLLLGHQLRRFFHTGAPFFGYRDGGPGWLHASLTDGVVMSMGGCYATASTGDAAKLALDVEGRAEDG